MDPYVKLIETGRYNGGTSKDVKAWRANPHGSYQAASWSDKARHLVRQVLGICMLDFIYDSRPGYLITEYARSLQITCNNFKKDITRHHLNVTEEAICEKAVLIIDEFSKYGPDQPVVISASEVLFYLTNDENYVPDVGSVECYAAYLDFRNQLRWGKAGKTTEPVVIEDAGILIPRVATDRIHLQCRRFPSYKFNVESIDEPIYNFFHFVSCMDFTSIEFLPTVGILASFAHELDYNSIHGTNSSIFYNLFNVAYKWEDPFNRGPKFVHQRGIAPLIDLFISLRRKHDMIFDRTLLTQVLQGTDMKVLKYFEQSKPSVVTTEEYESFRDSVFGEFPELKLNVATEEDGEDDLTGDDDNEPVEGGADDPEESADDDTEPVETEAEVKIHTNDNVGIEFTPAEADASIDGIVFRKEIRGLINSYLIDPPAKMSSQDLQILKTLKVYWLNLLSIPTILAIMKVANSPVKITLNNE